VLPLIPSPQYWSSRLIPVMSCEQPPPARAIASPLAVHSFLLLFFVFRPELGGILLFLVVSLAFPACHGIHSAGRSPEFSCPLVRTIFFDHHGLLPFPFVQPGTNALFRDDSPPPSISRPESRTFNPPYPPDPPRSLRSDVRVLNILVVSSNLLYTRLVGTLGYLRRAVTVSSSFYITVACRHRPAQASSSNSHASHKSSG